jgi:hypothetical protein
MADDENYREPASPEEAIEQAAEFLGVFAYKEFVLSDGFSWKLPNPGVMPRDMKRRHKEFQRFLSNDLDKEKIKDPITGRQREQNKWPLSYKGAEIDEEELLCIALMSESDKGIEERDAYLREDTLPELYKRFLNAGGVAGLVQWWWNVMHLQLEERVKRDPKSR